MYILVKGGCMYVHRDDMQGKYEDLLALCRERRAYGLHCIKREELGGNRGRQI